MTRANENLEWRKSIKGFLLDVTGVLYNSSPNGGSVIPGSVEAVRRLYAESKIRFVSNESTSTREKLREKLRLLGYDIQLSDIFTPAPVVAKYVKKHRLRPHFLIYKGIASEFDGIDSTEPNCVVVGDAVNQFSYENMNAAFRVLINKKNDPVLISLGCGRFYQRHDGPYMDVGGFAMALKYATDCRHVIIGKPEEHYFMSAVEDMGLKKDEVVMIGDDIVSDIAGAQNIGIRGVQVRTGKWRLEWEDYHIKPDLIADNLLAAVTTILDN